MTKKYCAACLLVLLVGFTELSLKVKAFWVLGPPGGTCDEACSKENSTCTNESIAVARNLTRPDLVVQAFRLAGDNTSYESVFPASGNDLPDLNVNTSTIEFNPDFGTTLCNVSAHSGSYRRLCCCGQPDSCAVTPPDPPKDGWVLGIPGSSCNETCVISNGGVCDSENEVRMGLIDTPEKVQGVAEMLLDLDFVNSTDDVNFTEAPGYLGTAISSRLLFNANPDARSSSCDAFDIDYNHQRFCCCGNNPERNCPIPGVDGDDCPSGTKSKSPKGSKSKSPKSLKSKFPANKSSKSKSPETKSGTSKSPKPGTSKSPKPGTSKSPKPGKSKSPKPGKSKSPKPGKSKSPKPGKSKSPKPGKSKSPEPGKSKSSKPGKSKSPKPGKSKYPKPGKSKSPKPGKSKSPKPGISGKSKAPKLCPDSNSESNWSKSKAPKASDVKMPKVPGKGSDIRL